MKKNSIVGLIAAAFTPMNDEGDLDLSVVSDYYRQLRDDGLAGVFVCGSAGEGVSLTIEERMAVLQAWKEVVQDDFKLLVHVGHTSYKESQKLARHAEQLGVDAIATNGPSFFKPQTTRDLADFCALIAGSCPQTPFYYYHIPGLSGVTLPMKEFLENAREIPNFAGLKFTNQNLYEYQQCTMVDPTRFNIMHGHDENLVAGLVLGAQAAVGSLYNQTGKLFHQIFELVKAGKLNEAVELQHNAVRIVDILVKYGGSIACGKAMQALIGIDCGPTRLPIRSLTEQQTALLKKELESIGFFQWR